MSDINQRLWLHPSAESFPDWTSESFVCRAVQATHRLLIAKQSHSPDDLCLNTN